MKFNSPLVQWLLKVALSKAGPYIAGAASWLAVHFVTWAGLSAFVPADQIAQIQHGISSGVEMIALSLMATVYAFVVHKQSQGARIAKAQIDLSAPNTPGIDLTTGAIGNATLAGLAKVTGVSVEDAAAATGVKLSS